MIVDSIEYDKVKKFVTIDDKCGTKFDEMFIMNVKFWIRMGEMLPSETESTTASNDQTNANE